MTTSTNGTLIFDFSDYKVKYKVPTNVVSTGWFNITVKTKSEIIGGITNNTVDSSLQDAKIELSEAKALIGGNFSTDITAGILVLADVNKAIVLPLVDKYNAVIAPSAGMMVYDYPIACCVYTTAPFGVFGSLKK